MNIKGQAKIELTDVNTGKKSVVRHDNMVTNAITKFFNNCGPHANPFETENTNYFTNPKKSFVTELFGGLYLFDGTLDESDPNDYAIPSNVSCVGYGARGTNSSINTMLGSYNKAESGLQEDGSYRFVWDFLTSQANGVISSLALAPPDVTIMGWDNKMNENLNSIGTNHDFWISQYSFNVIPNPDSFLFYDDEYIYSIKACNLYFSSNYVDRYFVNSKKLYIEKRRLVNKKVSIFGSYPFDTLPSEVIEVDLPEEILSKYPSSVTSAPVTYIHVEYDSGHIYLYVNNSSYVSSGGTFNLFKINVDDWTTSVISVTNTTGKNWYFRHSSPNRSTLWVSALNMRIMNGNIILSTGGTSSDSTKTQTFIINLADNTDVREVFYEDEKTPTGMTYTGIKYNDFLFIYGYTNGKSNLKVINIMTAKVFDFYNTSGYNCFCPFYTQGGVSYSYDTNFMIQNKDNPESFIYYNYYDNPNTKMVKTLNPLCLMTKNNLLEPVTKTSAQTMKVIYTISEVV